MKTAARQDCKTLIFSAIKILLYGLKPDASGTFWSEAGIRSVQYRNLEGKCRQTDLGAAKFEAKDRAMQ